MTLVFSVWIDALFLTGGYPLTATALTFILIGTIISGGSVLGAVKLAQKPE